MILDTPPAYSTDIAAAWTVVEKLQEKGFWLKLTGPFDPPGGHFDYWAGFTPHSTTGWNGRSDFEANSTSAPLAICWAALKAVEGDA